MSSSANPLSFNFSINLRLSAFLFFVGSFCLSPSVFLLYSAVGNFLPFTPSGGLPF